MKFRPLPLDSAVHITTMPLLLKIGQRAQQVRQASTKRDTINQNGIHVIMENAQTRPFLRKSI